MLADLLSLLLGLITSSPYVLGVFVAMALGLGATLIYPRYRRGVSWRVVRHHAVETIPPDGGTPVAAYFAELAADHWRDNREGWEDEPLAEVVDLGEARKYRRAA